MKTGHKVTIGVVSAAIVGLLGTAIAMDKNKEDVNQVDFDTITINYTEYTQRDDIDTYLFLGLDNLDENVPTENLENSTQADFNAVVVVDHAKQEINILYLNRDTMVSIPVTSKSEDSGMYTEAQLCLAHTFGSGGKDSCVNSKRTISKFLHGIEIDHYVALNMGAMGEVNDMVGGVTVKVSTDLTSLDPELKEGAVLTLKGDQALTYVRTRMYVGDGTNVARMQRQQDYIKGFIEAYRKLNPSTSYLLNCFTQLNDYITTDCTTDTMSKLFDNFANYQTINSYNITGTATYDDTYAEFQADQSSVDENVIKLFLQAK